MLNRLFLISIISAAFFAVTAQADSYDSTYSSEPYSSEPYNNEGSTTPAPVTPVSPLYPSPDNYPDTAVPYDGNTGSSKSILFHNPGRRPF